MTSAAKRYAGIAPYIVAGDSNIVGDDDKLRCGAYVAYDDIYHNRPDTFKVSMRGTSEGDDQKDILLPGARRIIEATNRFLAVDFDFVVDPAKGTPEGRKEADDYFTNLFKRERMLAKHANQRRYGLIRGDAIWHITADDTKMPGKRISIHEVHPGRYFPIEDPEQPNRVVGCHLVDVITHPLDPKKTVARRQTYRRFSRPNGEYGVTTSLGLYELGKWDDRILDPKDIVLIREIKPPTELPPQITSIPVYHIPNSEISGSEDIFGLSEVSGLETIMAARNQTISDEDLSLVLAGLGVYWTSSGPPRDASGNELPWTIEPGTVLEVGADQQFGRADGISSVQPFIDHMEYLRQEGDSAYGVPEVAAGRVDVAVAESGISLQLQFAPLLSKNGEKEQVIIDKYDHMWYDVINSWMPAYEKLELEGVSVVTAFGDPMPVNREAKIAEITGLIQSTPPLMTLEMAIEELSKLGYNYKDGDAEKLLGQMMQVNAAMTGDIFGNRYEQSLEDGSNVDDMGDSEAGVVEPQ